MRKILMFSIIFVASVMMFFPENGEAVTIEPDGYIGSGLSASSVGTLVSAIRARGYTCSSVTIARKLWGKTGFKVKCNRSTYSYEVIINEYGDYLILPD